MFNNNLLNYIRIYMKNKILFIFIFNPILCYSNNYNFITLNDEFDNSGKFTLVTSSSLHLKNSHEFLRRNVFDIQNYDNSYGSEKYQVLSFEQGIRYGLTNKINISGSINSSYSKYSFVSREESRKEQSYDKLRFDTINIGLSTKLNNFKSDWNKSIYFSSDAIIKNENTSFFKNFYLDYIIDKTIDPIVLSLKTGLKYYSKIKKYNQYFKPSNVINIKPRVDFLVNPQISISLSTEIQLKSSEKYNEKVTNVSGIENFLSIGISYNLNLKNRLYFETSFNTTGNSGATIYLNFEKDL
ncbi:hemin receptor [Haemophilus influenzae]|nr:hemin receptor [Haemophilus influenzae]OOD24344.1 hemin receptor [Haemophilus influenzae]PKF67091.1 hemin receptor [Haemophilus influenzae]POR99722.1 hemin receptor [Haemophilus influenzae]TWV01442.1 hemin receptor [Haemophilus influenzae]